MPSNLNVSALFGCTGSSQILSSCFLGFAFFSVIVTAPIRGVCVPVRGVCVPLRVPPRPELVREGKSSSSCFL